MSCDNVPQPCSHCKDIQFSPHHNTPIQQVFLIPLLKASTQSKTKMTLKIPILIINNLSKTPLKKLLSLLKTPLKKLRQTIRNIVCSLCILYM